MCWSTEKGDKGWGSFFFGVVVVTGMYRQWFKVLCSDISITLSQHKAAKWEQFRFHRNQSIFFCRSSESCSGTGSEPADLCMCEWLLCCCRGRTKWVQVTALLPLLAHIVSNYSSKHWHSMCGLTFKVPPSHAEQREREEDGQSRIIRFGKQWWDK